MTITLYHVHDPMCSWCWGYRRVWDELRSQLPPAVNIVNVVGGLAPDSDEPMPLEQQNTIAGYWRNVADVTGAEFNFEFWERCKPRRSTYPACRAVLAARRQAAEAPMINAIQQAYYLRAMNPSDSDTLIELAAELGLDKASFSTDLFSPGIERELQQELSLRRRLGVYSFPSLVLEWDDKHRQIEIDYLDYRPALAAINRELCT